MKTVYRVAQYFNTEETTEPLSSENFDDFEEAKNHFEGIKNKTQQGGGIITDLDKFVYNEDDIIDWGLSIPSLKTFYSEFDYEEHYGKLVVVFKHTGKGMNYSHEFVDVFFLDEYNEYRISDNPDYRFTPWTTITDIKIEDLEGLTYDDAVERVRDEISHLKLTNRIDLTNLDLNLVSVED